LYIFEVVVFVIEPETFFPIGNSIGEVYGGWVGIVIVVAGGSAWELLLSGKNSGRAAYPVRKITTVKLTPIIATIEPTINNLLVLFSMRTPSLLKRVIHHLGGLDMLVLKKENLSGNTFVTSTPLL